MSILHIDIETFSDVDLKKLGVYKYAESPNFRLLLLAYAYDDDPVQIVDIASGEDIPKQVLQDLENPNITKKAFNAQFERVCLDEALFTHTGPWKCTKIKAAYFGLNGSLDSVGKVLGIDPDKRKLEIGKNHIRLFSVPRKPSKANGYRTVYLPADKPIEWLEFKEYCIKDVEAERAIEEKLSFNSLPDMEFQIYQLDQKINDAGVKLDLDLAEAASLLDDKQSQLFEKKYHDITQLDSPRKLGKLKEWIYSRTGTAVTSITKDNLPILREDFKEYPDVVEALEIRQRLSRSSVSKYRAMVDLASDDGRARGLFRFYGAATGRWAGRGIQPQNLPRNYLSDLDTAREVIRQRDLSWIEMMYEDPADVLSQCIRTAIIPGEGKNFIVADFSAIEARVIAWLTGEQWRLDVFRTHGKIYEASAAQMFKVPIESIDKGSPLRQKGKVAELALGYQGSIGALRQMGALEMGLTDEELPELVSSWRDANPAIVSFWGELDNAARECIENRTDQKLGKLFLSYHHGMLFIKLPSGRELAYPKAMTRPHHSFAFGDEIAYSDLAPDGNWRTVPTYGGKLTENVVQAIARDCLVEAMLRLDAAGHEIVMHVHDEVVLEAPKDEAEDTLKETLNLMCAPLSWAPDLPLSADGFVTPYYKKD